MVPWLGNQARGRDPGCVPASPARSAPPQLAEALGTQPAGSRRAGKRRSSRQGCSSLRNQGH